MFKVEKGITVVASSSKKRVDVSSKYPFAKMEVGDSFVLSLENSYRASTILSSASKYHGEKLGMKFTVRQVTGGARCWRVA